MCKTSLKIVEENQDYFALRKRFRAGSVSPSCSQLPLAFGFGSALPFAALDLAAWSGSFL